MKQAVLELMKMSRICRVVVATCLGSFVLIIFYFQSTFQPVLRWYPFAAEACCPKGSHNAMHELYNLTQSEFSGPALLHRARRDRVAEACRLHGDRPPSGRALTPADLKHLVVDDAHRLLYCYVPKVACTNWKRLMMVLATAGGRGKYGDPMEIPPNEAHVPANLRTLDRYSAPEADLRLKSFLKFLFVREPFERLVSAYRNKFTLKYNASFHRRFGTRIVRRYRTNATREALRAGDDVTFREFVEYLVDPATLQEGPLNEHWESVHSLCHPCRIRYDLVGKYETLEEDSSYVLRLAGVADRLRFPAYPKSTRTTDRVAADFFRNVSSRRREQLYRMYELDFLMFNYSRPSYLSTD